MNKDQALKLICKAVDAIAPLKGVWSARFVVSHLDVYERELCRRVVNQPPHLRDELYQTIWGVDFLRVAMVAQMWKFGEVHGAPFEHAPLHDSTRVSKRGKQKRRSRDKAKPDGKNAATSQSAEGPDDVDLDLTLLDCDEVCRFFGGENSPLNPATLYRGIKVGKYPKPIKQSAGISRWLRTECVAALRDIMNARLNDLSLARRA